MDIQEFFKEHPKIALAFSGGVDSSFLLYAAGKYAEDVKAYYVKSPFQPQFEYEDAMKLASILGAKVTVINVDVLQDENVVSNPVNRCYFCKRQIFGHVIEAAKADGYTEIIDGTNASDDEGDRPGMKALKELRVFSPLKECGITKAEVRRLSKEADLFTWDKPAYACLATRIASGVRIEEDMLATTEKAEDILFEMGFSDFRIRYYEGSARIQVPESQIELLVSKRKEILQALKPLYKAVLMDLEVR